MTASTQRIGSLDILRSFAILAVVMFHSPFFAAGSVAGHIAGFGALGVNLFFVLSGYLISSQWFAELLTFNDASYSRFFLRRAFRIWPNYFAFLLFVIIFHGIDDLSPLWHYLFFLQNFFPANALGSTWSLCVEEHFYLLFPLIALFSFRRGWRVSLLVLLGLLALSVGLRLFLWTELRPDKISLLSVADANTLYYRYFYFPTFSRMDGLVFGVGIAALYRFQPKIWIKIIALKNFWLLAFGATFLATLALGSRTVGQMLPSILLVPGAAPDRGVLSAGFGTFGFDLSFAFLLLAALSPGSIFPQRRISFFYVTAILSYAIYLIHEEVIAWLVPKFSVWGVPSTGFLPIIVMFLFVYMGGTALYYAVERPALKLRDKILRV